MELMPDEIHLGAVDAHIHITAVMSLHCMPCTNAWKTFSRWLTTYAGLFRLTLRFHNSHSQHVEMTELIDALTDIYMKSGNNVFCAALTNWYENKDLEQWKATYCTAIPITPHPTTEKIAQWVQANSISAVPAVFVGDRIFPLELSDLEYLMKEL